MPIQKGKFLGLIVDSVRSEFTAPEDKVDFILSAIDKVLRDKTATNRQYCRGAHVCVCSSLHGATVH